MAKLVITTKGGDKGTTSLANGERVAKDDRRVELYGTVDECQAALGMARAFCEDEKTSQDIYFIEDYLFGTMAYFAKCDYDEPDPMILESMSDRVKDSLPDETMAFVRPGDLYGKPIDINVPACTSRAQSRAARNASRRRSSATEQSANRATSS